MDKTNFGKKCLMRKTLFCILCILTLFIIFVGWFLNTFVVFLSSKSFVLDENRLKKIKRLALWGMVF